MEKYSLNKYDFKNFLLKELPDTKQIDLIFWKKTIPMPVDLIYGIFEKRGELLRKYIDHIGAAFLFSYSCKVNGQDWQSALDGQPTKDNIVRQAELRNMFRQHMESSKVISMLKEIADVLLLYNYEVSESRLVNAICHEGRKYRRIYIPVPIRQIINRYNPELINCMAKSNWDMFSNVVADELKVYRMGFADAFSGIFNKLIDFILGFAKNSKKTYANASDIRIEVINNSETGLAENIYGTVHDGSLWEPRYINASSSFVLNEQHPYCEYIKNKSKDAEEVMIEIARYMAELENETVKDYDRKVIEIVRQELARKLRIKAEEIVTSKG